MGVARIGRSLVFKLAILHQGAPKSVESSTDHGLIRGSRHLLLRSETGYFNAQRERRFALQRLNAAGSRSAWRDHELKSAGEKSSQ